MIAGYGRASDLTPGAPGGDTIFELGSITKVFTALLLAEMAEAGLVGLDDPLEAHLPAGVSPPPGAAPITLADLASHTGGLPRDPAGVYRKAIRRPLHPFQALLDAFAALTPAELYQSLGRTKLKRHGSKARYSNLGAGLLGNLLADRAGASYEEVVRERVCLPLGMRDTFVDVPTTLTSLVADGHTRRGRPQKPFRDPALVGAGSLRSTASDMLRFLAANLDPPGTRLGSVIELAQRPRAKMGGRVEVGLGWLLAPLRQGRGRMLWHNGGTAGFRSFAGLVREAGTAVVVLGNTNRSVDPLALGILEQITP